MNKKNKVMLIAAIGMMAILVVSSAVRCSIVRTSTMEAEPVHEEQRADGGGLTDGGGSEADETAESAPDASAKTLETLRGNVWIAEGNPESKLTFRDGSFVESDESGVKITAFEVSGAGEGIGQMFLDVKLLRDGLPDSTATTIVINEADGGLTVSCDGFANSLTYVQGSASEDPIAVNSLCEPYIGLIDGKSSELAASMSAWCRSHAPSASAAAFDGEVFLDVHEKRVSATFHLNDAASSIVSVVYADGAFEIQG